MASRGLLAIDRSDVVRHHLTHLLRERRNDGLIARVLESVPSWKRVVAHTALRFLPDSLKKFPMTGNLKAEYLGEHGTISIDSNALVLRTAADLQQREPDSKWLEENHVALQEVLNFCLERTEQGTQLVSQGRFEDWQDSVAREGETLFVNALFAEAFAAAAILGLSLPPEASLFGDKLAKAFFNHDTGVFFSHAELELVSLDGNLLMLNEPALRKTLTDPTQLYARLKRHAIWHRAEIPGSASTPDYPIDWISWTTKAVGLRHYHDRLVWSWLSALAAKAAVLNDDTLEADRIFTKLTEMVLRDGAVAEVYSPTAGLPPVRTPLYVSEMPFSWGAGCILEALEARANLQDQ
ncbi:MAG: hypothetical protein EOP05_19855 [Proteobacteria bacterium]|nr:MAG: hypothetical protein EOP05_19855 [Pseudomonadota bacterium]